MSSIEAPNLFEGINETVSFFTNGLSELKDRISLKEEGALYRNFMSVNTNVDSKDIKEKSTGFMKGIGDVFNIDIPLFGTLGGAFGAKWPVDIFGNKEKRKQRKVINKLLEFFGVKGGLEELHRDYIDQNLKGINKEFIKTSFQKYNELEQNNNEVKDLWTVYGLEAMASNFTDEQKDVIKSKLPNGDENLKTALFESLDGDISGLNLNVSTIALLGEDYLQKDENNNIVGIDYQKIESDKSGFINIYLNKIIPMLALSENDFVASPSVNKDTFALAVFGCLVGERYFMEGLNIGLIDVNEYKVAQQIQKEKEELEEKEELIKKENSDFKWPKLLVGGGIVNITQEDIDNVNNEVPKIIEKIEIKGGFADIKEIKHNGKVIAKCMGKTPRINKEALEDFVGFLFLFNQKTNKKMVITSAYRTQKHQEELVEQNKEPREYRDAQGNKIVGQVPTAEVGYSGHNQGLSIDLQDNILWNLRTTELKNLRGLQELAGKFNFNKIDSEAWHFDHQLFTEQLAQEKSNDKKRDDRFAQSQQLDQNYQQNRA
ncbi:MAG: M15 family metallopeptidase [Candidatus Absconditabacteria bacterium]|nr:M15 family metallopeptidase [Candidatus Absconditabacteria bacterium]